jgi:hypothetical protein
MKSVLVLFFLMLALVLSACALFSALGNQQPTQYPTSNPIPIEAPTTTMSPLPTEAPTSTIPSRPNEYVTIAQLNLWFHGTGCYGGFEAFDCSGERTIALTPLLGRTYDSADSAVIKQQIDWAVNYGVDAFSIEWTTPRGVGASLEDNLDDAFLKAPNLDRIRWCIFYDFILRLLQTPELKVDLSNGVDFSDPTVAGIFEADFDHFAQKYFSQSQYLKIDGRPVVYVWGTWNARGNFADVIAQARQKAQAYGFDIFLVGDIIRTDTFNRKLAAVYDANTNFTFLIPGTPTWPKDTEKAAVALDRALGIWQSEIKGLKVAGREEEVSLEPGFAPQFDNRLADKYDNSSRNTIYVPAMSKDQVIAMAQVVRSRAQPVGSKGWKLVWLNTWNCWQEATTFEPTANEGPKYPAGNYQFDMLEVVRDIFGPETFPE